MYFLRGVQEGVLANLIRSNKANSCRGDIAKVETEQ